MSTSNEFDRLMTAWLDQEATPKAPDDLLSLVVARAGRTSHRPAWATPERWIPMETRARFGAVPRTAIVIAVLGLLLAAFTAISLASGSAPPPKLPPPYGLARNGLIAFGLDGDVWVMDQHGEHKEQLTSNPDLDVPGVWSPDGTWLAFWSIAYAGDPSDEAGVNGAFNGLNGSIRVIRADGTDQRILAADLKWPPDCGTDLAWAPDSQQIAYAHHDGVDSRVEVVAVSGGEPRMVVRGGVTPTWSPDGLTIAYMSDTSEGVPVAHAIWLVSAAGGVPTRLTHTHGLGCAFNEPQWSTDGTRITFYNNDDGVHDIWVAKTDGSGEQALAAESPDEYWPRWSPDDSQIAFDRVVLSNSNAPQFVLMDPDGRNQAMLDHTPLAARYPTWSPDGTLLLGMTMSADYQDTTGLMLVDVSGAEAPVTFETGKVWGDPSWQRLAIE